MISSILLLLFTTRVWSDLPASQVAFLKSICATTNVQSQFVYWCKPGYQLCQWDGVVCDATNSTVIFIDMTFTFPTPTNYLTGSLPNSFAPLPDLEGLTVINTALTFEFGPQLFAHNHAMQKIIFQSTPVTGVFSFDNVPANVDFLWITHTKITGNLVGDLSHLDKMVVMTLFGPGFTGTLPFALFALPHLVILNIQQTRLTGAIPDQMCDTSIPIMELSNNRFTSRPNCLFLKTFLLCALMDNLFCTGLQPTDGNCIVDDPPVGVDDQCFVCSGNGQSCVDCKGVPFGTSVVDICATCGGGVTIVNDCPWDCFGTPNGTLLYDACDVCDGDGTTCRDCAGRANGPAVYDACDVCNGNGLSCIDCFGVFGGSATYDACDVCDGDASTCRDCAGRTNGAGTYDACDVCNGHGRSCSDCSGVPYGTLKYDRCDVCGGDNTLCGLDVVVPQTRGGIAWVIALAVLLLISIPLLCLCILYRRRRGARTP